MLKFYYDNHPDRRINLYHAVQELMSAISNELTINLPIDDGSNTILRADHGDTKIEESADLAAAAFAIWSPAADVHLGKRLFVCRADRFAVHRIKVFVDRLNELQFLEICQFQEPVKDDRDIFAHRLIIRSNQRISPVG